MPQPEQKAEPRNVETLTFGCRLNIGETEDMLAAAEAAGQTNLLIVNTCAVTADASREAAKAIRRRKRENPGLRIVATGCAVEVEAARFAAMPEIDRIVPNADKTKPEIWGSQAPASARGTAQATHTRGFLEIQNGCDHRCTFCVIPFGRGASRSRSVAEIVERAARLVEDGRKEIVLTGVDLTSWSAVAPDVASLGQLTREILRAVPALPRLRLSSLDCAEIDDDLRSGYAEEPRLMPHLHLSLQAGSDLVLKRMMRRHSRADAVRFCRQLRSARPNIALSADLIVGFPTETEEMFRETLALVEECELTSLHVFPFSPRPGTPAARMPQVAPAVVKERATRLRALGDRVLAQRLEQRVGSNARVLVEHGGRGHDEDFARVQTPSGVRRGDIVELVVSQSTGRELIGILRSSRTREADLAYAPAAAP
jgi:threonylcarbamoyladenosine tRNA methylthiotransferase MtaB